MTAPTEFVCPITKDLFDDPVSAADGHTYERAAIKHWLVGHNTSPMTGGILDNNTLTPNFAIRALVQDFKAKQAPMASEKAAAEPPAPPIDFKLQVSSFNDKKDLYKIIGDVPPPGGLRIHFSMDVSGSMGSAAEKSGVKASERHGFSLLDIAKSGLQLAIKSAPENTILSVDSFSNLAAAVVKPCKLSDASRALARREVAAMYPRGCTNLWDAIKSSIKACEGNPEAIVYILTDGEPSEQFSPSRGILKTFKALTSGCPTPQINFLAFGNEPDVQLLCKIAEATKGQLYQIPEAAFIGTIFTNALANAFTRYASNAKLYIDGILRSFRPRISDATSFILDKVDCPVTLRLPNGIVLKAEKVGARYPSERAFESLRLSMVHTLSSAAIKANEKDFEGALELCNDFMKMCKNGLGMLDTEPDTKYLKAIQAFLDDFTNADGTDGQILMAFRTHYATWGQSYVLSLIFAHRYKETNNYVDRGTQIYAGGAAGKEAARIGDIYDAMPPPKASLVPMYRSAGVASTPPPVSMLAAGFSSQNYGGGCFVGSAIVRILNGFKRVDEVVIGDQVFDPLTKSFETVEGVFEIIADLNRTVCSVGRLELTPWHPVMTFNGWAFPREISPTSEQHYSGSVYDFVTSGKSIVASGVTVALWGHELEGAVIAHPFFGSREAILKAFPDYMHNFTRVDATRFKRKNGMICSYI